MDRLEEGVTEGEAEGVEVGHVCGQREDDGEGQGVRDQVRLLSLFSSFLSKADLSLDRFPYRREVFGPSDHVPVVRLFLFLRLFLLPEPALTDLLRLCLSLIHI